MANGQEQRLREVLDPLAVPRSVKRSTWDAFYRASDEDDFKRQLDALDLPQEVKRELWDLRFAAAPVTTTPTQVQAGPPTPPQETKRREPPLAFQAKFGIPTGPPTREELERHRAVGEKVKEALDFPLAPLSQLITATTPQPAGVPTLAGVGEEDPSRWVLNTITGLGRLPARTVEFLSTPKNLALLGTLAVAPHVGVPRLVMQATSLGFSLAMANETANQIVTGIDAARRGDLREAGERLSDSVVTALFSIMAGRATANPNLERAGIRALWEGYNKKYPPTSKAALETRLKAERAGEPPPAVVTGEVRPFTPPPREPVIPVPPSQRGSEKPPVRVVPPKPPPTPKPPMPSPTEVAAAAEPVAGPPKTSEGLPTAPADMTRRAGPPKPPRPALAAAEPVSRRVRTGPPTLPSMERVSELAETPKADATTPPSVAAIAAPKEPLGRSAIIRQVSELLEIPIRKGHLGRTRLLGLYKRGPEVIRTRLANDLRTVAHEAGHHIHKILWGLDVAPFRPYKGELKPLATEGHPLREGFAEFMTFYIANPEKAKAVAPKFHDFFMQRLSTLPDLAELLQGFQQRYAEYAAQTPKAKLKARIVYEAPRTPRNSVETFYAYSIDALRPLQRMVQEISSGRRVPTDENAYELARLFAGWWGKADHFLQRGTFDADTLQVTGKGFMQILEPVRDRIEDFDAFVVARRTLEKSGQGIKTGTPPGEAAEVVRELDNPAFRQAAKELTEYNNSLLTYLRKSGFLDEAQYQKILKLNEDYVPFHRLFVGRAPTAERAANRTYSDLWSPVRRMRGGEEDIWSPTVSVLRNTYTLINLAERNRVGLAVVREGRKVQGKGWVVEELPTPVKPTSFELLEIKRTLEEAGADLSEADLETVATVFRPMAMPPKGNYLTVFEGGKRKFIEVHPDLHRVLKGLDEESSNLLLRIVSLPARALRLGATTIGPEFVIRNPIRDTMTAFVQSKHGFVPGVDTLRGIFHALKRDDLYWEWKRAGGEHAAMVSLDRTTLRRSLDEMLQSRVRFYVAHPVEALRIFSEFGEAGTRIGEFARARARGVSPREAAFAAREVSLDFARMGSTTRALNSIAAFWNAAVQGTDKFARVHLDNPMGTWAKATAGITVPSLLLYAINRNDPVYQELPRWVKDFFWLVPTKGTPLEDKTPFISIPKPFLWGLVYGSAAERVAEWIDKQDPSAFDELLKNIGATAAPQFLPTGLVPLIETWANKSLYTGQQLEPEYLRRVAREHRAHPWTSAFARDYAQWLKHVGFEVSPIAIDNAIFGYTGGFGRAIVHEVLEPLLYEGPPKPERTAADITFLRGFVTRWPTGQARSVQDFYDRLGELEQKEATARGAKRYRAFEAEKPTSGERAELRRLRRYAENLQRIDDFIREAHYGRELTPEQKRRRLETLTLRKITLAQRALRRKRPSGTPPPSPAPPMPPF